MRLLLLITIMTLGSLTSTAQNTIIPLYKSNIPGNTNTDIKEKRTTSGSGSAILTNVTTPELWYFSAGKELHKPAIIVCPGGGYHYEAYEHEGKQVAEWLAELGYQAFVLKYRLPQDNLFSKSTYIPLTDARKAISLVREKADELGVDPENVGIMGFSAGGHLAASASTLFDKEIPFGNAGSIVRPDFSILIYPVISMTKELTHQGSREALLGKNPSTELINFFSCEKQVTPNTPPTFIAHASDDGAVPVENTKKYAEALRANNIAVKEVILPKGGHGFGFRKKSPAFEWTNYLARWLKENIQ